jgi:hypothetical protein
MGHAGACLCALLINTPWHNNCGHQPPVAPREACYSTPEAAGSSHRLLVHASANGFDSSGMLAAITQHSPRVRAIGVMSETSSDMATDSGCPSPRVR